MEQQQQKLSNPLQYLLKKMEGCEGGVKEIFIPDLLTGSESNVIVVDGSNFYGLYVYPNFDWICGDLAALVDVIRRFVLAFENVGAKLVFFFVDGHIDEGKKVLGSEEWRTAHSEYAKYAIKFYDSLKSWRGIDKIKTGRAYYHTPFHAQSVVLYVLKHVLKCEINLVDSGYRNDTLAYYARSHKCCAVLVEDKLYLFYKDLPNYLSLRNLDLQNMKTKLYNPEVLPNYFGISEQHLYPIVAASITGKYSELIISELNKIIDNYNDKEFVRYKGDFLVWCNGRLCSYKNNVDDSKHRCDNNEKKEEEDEKKGNEQKLEEITNKQAGKKDNPEKDKEKLAKEGNQQNEVEHEEIFFNSDSDSEETDSDNDSENDLDSLVLALKYAYVCHNKGYKHYRPTGPSNEWKTIYLRAKELYTEGLISRRLKILINSGCFFNDCILEDFNEFPPSSLIYQPLRKKMYSILFHEANPKSFEGGVVEYCMSNRGCRILSVKVDALEPNIKNMHLGLLKLWNLNDTSDEVVTAKWQLFSSCLTFRLCNEFQNLPPTLVIPTTVLLYLHQKVPRMFKIEKITEPWEVDVFIVHFLMVPKISSDDLAKIQISKYNSRALKLIAMFVYGCLNMQLLVEVCGNVIKKNDTCLLHYFNGKLFHDLYEKAAWRRKDIEHKLCDEESLKMFHKIKQIVCPV